MNIEEAIEFIETKGIFYSWQSKTDLIEIMENSKQIYFLTHRAFFEIYYYKNNIIYVVMASKQSNETMMVIYRSFDKKHLYQRLYNSGVNIIDILKITNYYEVS